MSASGSKLLLRDSRKQVSVFEVLMAVVLNSRQADKQTSREVEVDYPWGLRFQQLTLDDSLDGYKAQLNMPPERVSLLTKSEKSKRASYVNYRKPFTKIFCGALSDLETLFGNYISEFDRPLRKRLWFLLEQTSRRTQRRKWLRAEAMEICSLDFHSSSTSA